MSMHRWLNEGKPPSENTYTQIREEPTYILKARAARAILATVEANSAALTTAERKGIEKKLNTILLNAMDEARAIYMESQESLGKTTK